MLRKFSWAVAALFLGTGVVSADSIPGKVKSVDATKSTITVTVDDKDQTFTVAKDSKIFQLVGKGKKAQPQDLADGLTGLKEGQTVVLTTEKKDDKDVVTQIKLDEPAKKKKKNK